MRVVPGGWRSHEEIIAWQLASELKNRVNALIEADPRIQRDVRFSRSSRGSRIVNAPTDRRRVRTLLPGDFSGYLRKANGELKETLECLTDGVDRGDFTREQIVPLRGLCKRASKAATGLIAYLKTADAPNEEPRRRRTSGRREPKNPKDPQNRKNQEEPIEHRPPEPTEPLEPMEPMD